MPNLKKILADNVRRLLASRDGARTEIATRMGVGDGTLGRILYGTANPSLETLDQIASFFRVSVVDLLSSAEKTPQVRDSASEIDDVRLSDAIDAVSKLLDHEGLALPRSLFARAVALVYSSPDLSNRTAIQRRLLELIKSST
jgi:transcriptional regulator with XRE-family HTH domain